MKRWLALPLLLLYFFISTGMIVQLHYCSEQLSSVAINGRASCCCDEGSASLSIETEDSDCCQNKTIKAPTLQDQLVSAFYFINSTTPATLPSTHDYVWCGTMQTAVKEAGLGRINAPPILLGELPLYKKYHCWIFYS